MMDGEEVNVAITTGPPYSGRIGPPSPLLGAPFDRALLYAAGAHRRQARKGSGVPYLSHLLGVSALVLEHGGDEIAAIGALLHDTIEDCGSEHAQFIRAEFG